MQDDVKYDIREKWKQEIFVHHRWGRHGDRACEEHLRLKEMWNKAQPLDEPCLEIVSQIISLEICNWRLEQSILALCAAIGEKKPALLKIGHMASMTQERWKKIWAYYYTCRDWLSGGVQKGYKVMLTLCDHDTAVQNHILGMLGSESELKNLAVERFCLFLEFMIGGQCAIDSAPAKSHEAAVAAIEEEIRGLDSEASMLKGFIFDKQYCTYAGLSLCHHKLFRRLDIILSSIGAGTWRASMPMRGTDGLERAATLEKYLTPIERWIKRRTEQDKSRGGELFQKIQTLLGESDNQKKFLASLLVSLLRSQQLFAKQLAEKRRNDLQLDSRPY